ncbi:hypothetical protein QTN25_007850 [Entamoeba marina]
MTSLEYVYMLNVVLYFDSMDIVKQFILVSKKCLSVIRGMKRNLCLDSNDPLTLQNNLQLFNGIDTVYMDLKHYQQHIQTHWEQYHYFYITDLTLCQLRRIEQWMHSKLVYVIIDTAEPHHLQNLQNLKQIKIIHDKTSSPAFLVSLALFISNLKYINNVVIHTDSAYIPSLVPFMKELSSKVKCTFHCQYLTTVMAMLILKHLPTASIGFIRCDSIEAMDVSYALKNILPQDSLMFGDYFNNMVTAYYLNSVNILGLNQQMNPQSIFIRICQLTHLSIDSVNFKKINDITSSNYT